MSWEGQYVQGTAVQVSALFVDLGLPVTVGAAIIHVWYPGDPALPTINGAAMTHLANGIWYYNCAALSTIGIYKVRVAIVALNLYAGGSFEIIEDKLTAIKNQTDNLPSDPADESMVEVAITTAQGVVTGAIATSETAIRGGDGDTLETLSDQLDICCAGDYTAQAF